MLESSSALRFAGCELEALTSNGAHVLSFSCSEESLVFKTSCEFCVLSKKWQNHGIMSLHHPNQHGLSLNLASLGVFLFRCLIAATAYDEKYVSRL